MSCSVADFGDVKGVVQNGLRLLKCLLLSFSSAKKCQHCNFTCDWNFRESGCYRSFKGEVKSEVILTLKCSLHLHESKHGFLIKIAFLEYEWSTCFFIHLSGMPICFVLPLDVIWKLHPSAEALSLWPSQLNFLGVWSCDFACLIFDFKSYPSDAILIRILWLD